MVINLVRGIQQVPILGLWGANGIDAMPNDSSFGLQSAIPSTGLNATVLAAGELQTYATLVERLDGLRHSTTVSISLEMKMTYNNAYMQMVMYV